MASRGGGPELSFGSCDYTPIGNLLSSNLRSLRSDDFGDPFRLINGDCKYNQRRRLNLEEDKDPSLGGLGQDLFFSSKPGAKGRKYYLFVAQEKYAIDIVPICQQSLNGVLREVTIGLVSP